MEAYERLLAARAYHRPDALRFIGALIDDFVQLHGDRRFADDQAMIAGLGYFEGQCVTVLALEKGSDPIDRMRRNFGSAQPEGYRKALYHMRQAEKFGRPILCLIDTAGAACGIGAEERGQGQAIAECLTEMMGLSVPVFSLIIGEGGSGGALALACGSEVWMLENAVYSVISPEGAASILFKDSGKAADAAQALKITAEDMLALKVIDGIIKEGETLEETAAGIRATVKKAFNQRKARSGRAIRDERYARFRKIGGCAG